MPRKPRFFLPDVPVHAVVRGNNRQVVFAEEGDYRFYKQCLAEAADRYDCNIHAYVLMTNHIHLLLSSGHKLGISQFIQHVGRKYVPYFNDKYSRCGTLWQGRFKAASIDSDRYLFACYRYIELNPVSAAMVERAEEYPWSSHRANLGLAADLVVPHALYLQLGGTPLERGERYGALFSEEQSRGSIQEIRAATQTGTPIGSQRFIEEIEQLLGRKVGYKVQGRPIKGTDPF